jgi:AraC-like DNA-binding protein
MDYADKDDLFRSHLSLIFHEAIQMRRTENVTDKGFQRVARGFEYQSYFNRFFKKYAGVTPSDYRKTLKSINSALKCFWQAAKEIAYELGFEDAGHFSRFFKNMTDQNISEYKKDR